MKILSKISAFFWKQYEYHEGLTIVRRMKFRRLNMWQQFPEDMAWFNKHFDEWQIEYKRRHPK